MLQGKESDSILIWGDNRMKRKVQLGPNSVGRREIDGGKEKISEARTMVSLMMVQRGHNENRGSYKTRERAWLCSC